DLDVAAAGRFVQAEPLVVIVDGDGEDLLRPRLTDDVLVKLLFDRPRRRDVRDERLGRAAAALFLVDDRLAQLDAFAADVDVVRPLDERADVPVAFAAKRTVGVAVAAGVAGRAAPAVGVFRGHAVS